ncbi:MAG: hypothetical protein JSW67_01065 [Candidatus Latescibacterota bacterium]|nr:MAG: hypothetical protein JSW67_01065 [Candidatus Latescibacterota bacterium]
MNRKRSVSGGGAVSVTQVARKPAVILRLFPGYSPSHRAADRWIVAFLIAGMGLLTTQFASHVLFPAMTTVTAASVQSWGVEGP